MKSQPNADPTGAHSSRPGSANPASQLLRAAKRLAQESSALTFSPPVSHVYHPLIYAWKAHAEYLRKFGATPKRILFLGMNPGPFGMTQTGVPFGEISAVRHWLQIEAPIGKPDHEHPRRPVLGFDCPRSEISGQRLWGLFARRFKTASSFFADHLVLNYCPVVFLEESGRNRTPDKLPPQEREPLVEICDRHLRAVVAVLLPEWIIGVGAFAAERAREALGDGHFKIGQILHPSPASPAANRDWAGLAAAQLEALGVW